MVVMDSLALLAYLQSGSSALNDVISGGIVVSSVTVHLVEWALVEGGAKQSEVRADLQQLGLEIVEFTERFTGRVQSLRSEVSNLSLDAALAMALSETRKLELVSGERMLEGKTRGVRVVT
jgi:PIN domain nuclease of toxin-antitoxin system